MRTEGHVAIVQVENEAKKNAFTPEMVVQLSDHFTAFDDDDNLWAMVFCAAGEHTTAGLDMRSFSAPKRPRSLRTRTRSTRTGWGAAR